MGARTLDRPNLLVWFSFDETGGIDAVVNLQLLESSFDLDNHFERWMSSIYSGGGVEKIERQHIRSPRHLLGIEGVAYVMYYGGKRFRAALPYFTTISKE